MKYWIGILSLCMYLVSNGQLVAQSPVGTWVTVDDRSGEERSHLRIYEEEGKLYGRITKLLDDRPDARCIKCKGEKKDKPVLGMVILRDLSESGDAWTGGYILDPENGREYKCRVSLQSDNRLEVRGYIGMPTFGRSQIWKKL